MRTRWRPLLVGSLPALALAAAVLVPTAFSPASAEPAQVDTTRAEQARAEDARAATARKGPLSVQERARQAELSQLVLAAPGARPTDEALKALGFLVVSEDPSQELVATTNSDVTMGTPYVYWDTTYYRYTAVAKYTWDNQRYGCCGDIGGDDAFGIRANRAVGNDRGTTGTFSGRPKMFYGTTVVKNPAKNNDYGVVYKYQDEAHGLCCGKGVDYNMYSGTVTMGVDSPGCKKYTTYFYGEYGHTWSRTDINSISVGKDGIGFGWSRSDSHWEAASPAGKWNGC